MSQVSRILLLAVLVAVLLPALASACPLCKDAKADTDYPGGSASLPKGFYYSILLMASAPFVLTGGFALRVYLSRRRARALAAASTSEVSVTSLLPDSRGARP